MFNYFKKLIFSRLKNNQKKKFFKIKNIILFFFISLILFISIIFYFTNNFKAREFLNRVDEKILYRINISIVDIGDKIVNEFDFVKLFKRTLNDNPDLIKIELSPSDLRFYQEQRKKLSSKVWISNDEKKWRKAKIIIDGEKSNIKIKIHGSSTTYIKKNIFSFKIKHPKEGPYLNLLRQYNLLNYQWEAGKISGIAINNMARDFGLITSPQKTVILEVNGVKYGLFRLEESLGKDYLFERNYQLPNFTIIRTSDYFDRKFYGEVSNLELDENFYVLDGSSEEHNAIALGALKKLLKSIKDKKIKEITELIDLDYYAKFFAFVSLYNYAEYGSDMKLIFDHDIGKFKIIFRAEENHLAKYSNVNYLPNFNTRLINEWKSGTFEIFKILLSNKEFVNRRDKYLLEIVNKRNNFKKIINQTYLENEKNIIHSNQPITLEKFLKTKLLKDTESNINIIDEYLNYGNFYITSRNVKDQNNNIKVFSILSDTFVDHYIDGFYDNNGNYNPFKEKIILNKVKNFFKIKLGEHYDENHTELKLEDNLKIANFKIINYLNNKEVDKKKQFFNKLKNTFKSVNYLKVIDKFKINFKIMNNNFHILAGEYYVEEDIIFPEGLNVIFEKGVKLTLSKNSNILIRGSFFANGTKNERIIIKSTDIFNETESFGSVVLIGEKSKDVIELSYFDISGGKDTNISFIKTTGQMHINNYKDVRIENSFFNNSHSDDGLNIKNSNVLIKNSKFLNNNADQLDLDNCSGEVIASIFSPMNNIINKNGDGLDLSHSKFIIKNNTFKGNQDKGISIGENSNVKILKNIIVKNNIGIAVKDGSKAFFNENYFDSNEIAVSKYNKKYFYEKPVIIGKNLNK